MFCLFCGAKVEAQTKCKACYAALPPGSKFCNICGAPQ
jgi:rRNA maturation endonuclease Nob1